MIDSVKLSLVAEALSRIPCPDCGKCHKVEINCYGSALRPVVSYKFPDGACSGFKELVSKRLSVL